MKHTLTYLKSALLAEVKFETSRSGGKGGQNVNKVETKVDLIFDLTNSYLFTDFQKNRLSEKLANRLNEGIIRLSCSESRSQLKNKQIVVERLAVLLFDGLKVQKKRIPTKISAAKKKARLVDKKIHKTKKINRQKPSSDD